MYLATTAARDDIDAVVILQLTHKKEEIGVSSADVDRWLMLGVFN